MIDLAAGRKAIADSESPGHPAGMVVDGAADTFWRAADGSPGHTWEVDLGAVSHVSHIEIVWEKDNPYEYALHISLDNIHWVKASDTWTYTAAAQETADSIRAYVRYIRITVTGGVSEENRVGICAFRAIEGEPPAFINGADLSSLQQIEDFGGKYYDRDGAERDCLAIMKDCGVNYIRLKVWNKPGLPYSDPAGYNDKAHVLAMAKRVYAYGFQLLIDFHYSDWWADPGKQWMPEEWKGLSFPQLEDALYDFTYDVVSALKAQGTPPGMVQIGNEITNGMLWDVAKVSEEFDTDAQWDKLCALLKKGIAAVKDMDPSIRTIVHIERSGDNQASVYFYNHLLMRNVAFDYIGLSYYPIFHGAIEGFKDNIRDLSRRYGKGIIVVETGFPWTAENGDSTPNVATSPYASKLEGYPVSVQGQADALQAVISIVKDTPEGLGFFYWEPDFIPVEGAGWKYGEGCEWDDQILFDFTGHALWSLDVFRMHRANTVI
jgi:arabinogalactan endo-1,4-beta-galactosidase